MAENVKAPQPARRIEHDLRAILEAENADNNGMIIYIRNGELAFDTYDNLFTVVKLD